MKIPRQEERRSRFEHAFGKMPLWETWTTEIPAPKTYTIDEAVSAYEAGILAVSDVISDTPPKPIIKHHLKLIPRRVRRSMARDLARREYRRDHAILGN